MIAISFEIIESLKLKPKPFLSLEYCEYLHAGVLGRSDFFEVSVEA
jgi:hypothetical protein